MTDRDVYIGIDQSVGGFGLCLLFNGETHKFYTEAFPLSKYQGKEVWQLHAVEDFLINALGGVHDDVKLVAREGFSYGSIQGREKAGAIAYAVDSTLYEWLKEPYCYPVIVAPTQLKEFATGSGGASKEDVKKSVDELWNVQLTNDNLADAYVLAQIAYSLDKDAVTVERQRSVLESIRNPPNKKKKKAA